MMSSREQTEVTQKQLAVFRRENAEIETKAALVVLEGGKSRSVTRNQSCADAELVTPEDAEAAAAKKTNPYDNLLVLKRIRLEREGQ